jgi:hypothetical protein
LHLWQIQHFPNNRHGLRSLTGRNGVGSASAPAATADAAQSPPSLSGGRQPSERARNAHDDSGLTVGARIQGADAPRSVGILLILTVLAFANAASAQDPKPNPAADYVRRAHLALVARQTIQADIDEVVNLSDPPFRMTGSYASAGLRTRLSYTVKLSGGASGSLLEVCDGERLWSVTELPGSTRVTRRDVRQILAAVESAKARPDRAAAVDLALGGLPALLASLQRSMQFDALKEETSDGRKLVVIQARWKPDIVKRLGGDASGNNLPAHIPDIARIYFAADTAFPEEVLYLKKNDDAKKVTYRKLLDLRFQNVRLDEPVDDKAFEFTPPNNVEPEDVTRQYLEQLFPPEPTPATERGASAP